MASPATTASIAGMCTIEVGWMSACLTSMIFSGEPSTYNVSPSIGSGSASLKTQASPNSIAHC
ncbi:hypothetical protein D3C76_1812740 [compost metagenome]